MGNKIIKKIAEAQPLAADFESDIIPVGPFVDNLGFNIDCTAVTDNAGVFTVQHRIKKDYRSFSAWATLCMSFNPTLENVDAVFFINLNQVPIGELRIAYEALGTVPDGLVDIWFSGRNL